MQVKNAWWMAVVGGIVGTLLAAGLAEADSFYGTAFTVAYWCSPLKRLFSYTDNGDGTFTDKHTLFTWEKKDTSGSIHDVNNVYTWSSTAPGAADGTAFTVFLATLNTSPCFANHCDWRIPNGKELQSLVDYITYSPASRVPGCTAADGYWSSSTFVAAPSTAWLINFLGGSVLPYGKTIALRVRAVRGDR